MITWGDILVSLNMVHKDRLADPAALLCQGDYIQMDILELEIEEIGDVRLVAVPLKEIDDGE